jgi:hypothetical protein
MRTPRRQLVLQCVTTGALIVVAVCLGLCGWISLPWVSWLLIVAPFVVYTNHRRRNRELRAGTFYAWSSRHTILHRLIGTSPECMRFPDVATRDQAIRRIALDIRNTWWHTPLGLAACLVLLESLEPLSSVISRAIPIVPWAAAYVLLLVLWVAGFSGIVWVIFRADARHRLREGLVALGVPICLHCGYDLRGQIEPRCPECGRTFDPALLNRQCSDNAGAQ